MHDNCQRFYHFLKYSANGKIFTVQEIFAGETKGTGDVPAGLSYSTPIHCPAANCVGPMKRIYPVLAGAPVEEDETIHGSPT